MEFNPVRLIVARQRRGLSRIALSRQSGIAIRTLTYYESGNVVPSEEAIGAISKILRFPKPFFFGTELEDPNCEGVSFRALSAITAKQRDMALAAGTLAMELSKWIEKRFELPVPNLPSLRGFTPEAAAQVLRAEWGLGERPIKNVVHILEAHGVRVFSLPIDSANVDAFSLWHNDTPFVFLNQQKSAERGRMDGGHELGHLTMHKHGAPRGRQAEWEADRFGSAFLMPAGSILAHIPKNITLPRIHELKLYWGVSSIALVQRLKTLDVITEWQYRSLCIQISKEGGRRTELNGINRDTSQVLTKVFELLREDGVSRGSIARDLLIEPSELDSWIVGLSIASLPGGLSGKSSSTPRAETPKLKIV